MASEDETKVKSNGLSTKHTLVVAIVSAVLGSTGGPYLLDRLLGFNPYRADPFTGTEAALLASRLERIEDHVENHPDVELRASIALIRADIAEARAEREQIIRNQDRILDRLDKR